MCVHVWFFIFTHITHIYTHTHSQEGEEILLRSFTRATTRDQIVDIKGPFPHYCTKCKRATRTVKWRIVGDATSSVPATGVSLFPRLSRSATTVLYWLCAFRVTRVVDIWKLL